MGLRGDEAACGREEVSTAHTSSWVGAYLTFSAPSWTTAGLLDRNTKNRVSGEFKAYVWMNGAYVPLYSTLRDAGVAGRLVAARGAHSARLGGVEHDRQCLRFRHVLSDALRRRTQRERRREAGTPTPRYLEQNEVSTVPSTLRDAHIPAERAPPRTRPTSARDVDACASC